MLLCYVLYVNFVIVYYLALIYYQFYGSNNNSKLRRVTVVH